MPIYESRRRGGREEGREMRCEGKEGREGCGGIV